MQRRPKLLPGTLSAKSRRIAGTETFSVDARTRRRMMKSDNCHAAHYRSQRQQPEGIAYRYTGWPNKKKATLDWSLNRIENPSIRLDFEIKFACNRNTGLFSVGIEYSMRDLIRDVINISVLQYFLQEKYTIYDQIVIKKTRQREQMYIKEFVHEFSLRDDFWMKLIVY